MKHGRILSFLGALALTAQAAPAAVQAQLQGRLEPATATGRTITLRLEAADADVGLAGAGYVILVGASGSSPGFRIPGAHVPLNLDALTGIMFQAALLNAPIQKGLIGFLDANGAAGASVSIGPEVEGLLEALGVRLTFAALGHRDGETFPAFVAGPAEVDFAQPAVQ